MRDLSAQASFFERCVLFLGLWALWALVYYGTRLLPHATNAVLSWDPVWHVPYVNAFVVPYTSAYPLPSVLLFVPCDRRTFLRICGAFTVAFLVSAPLFVLIPLTPPRVALSDAGLLDRLLALQYRFDVNGNCFPSLHVSLSMLTALSVGHCVKRLRIPALVWAALIAVSTVFVHQHYVVDSVAGTALALVVWHYVFRPSRASD
jgi:membrane-associated phospholipid phosphatase